MCGAYLHNVSDHTRFSCSSWYAMYHCRQRLVRRLLQHLSSFFCLPMPESLISPSYEPGSPSQRHNVMDRLRYSLLARPYHLKLDSSVSSWSPLTQRRLSARRNRVFQIPELFACHNADCNLFPRSTGPSALLSPHCLPCCRTQHPENTPQPSTLTS